MKKTIVFTTGTFDIIHYGHINLLKKAKELGDYLVVGINLTKNGKPTMMSWRERQKVLEAIKYVDKVVLIRKQQDKFRFLKRADIFAIGSDYIGYSDIDEIKKHCNVKFIERTPNISSTEVKKRISDNTKYNTIVVDIDDTICFTKDRKFDSSKPNKKVIKKINELYDKGWTIILYTARGAKSCKTLEERIQKYNKVTTEWLKAHNVHYHQLLFGKMNADYYVDDKNMSIEQFINFKGETR